MVFKGINCLYIKKFVGGFKSSDARTRCGSHHIHYFIYLPSSCTELVHIDLAEEIGLDRLSLSPFPTKRSKS